MHDSQLERDIEEVIYKVFSRKVGIGVGLHTPECCKQEGSLTIYTTKDNRYHNLSLPSRIPEKHVFPAEAMLHFMGQAPLPTKRAKPRDWIEMAEQFAKEVRAKYDDELKPK